MVKSAYFVKKLQNHYEKQSSLNPWSNGRQEIVLKGVVTNSFHLGVFIGHHVGFSYSWKNE